MSEIYLVMERDPYEPDRGESILAAYTSQADAEARRVKQYEAHSGKGTADNYRGSGIGKDIDRHFRVSPIELL